ncbi:hypothetical protein [Streptomyces sp. 5-10]|uniref:hypothetical protein n=1 Tax=Streptomyces sp. 5-10 TaxID=878925 RepID=UPI00168B4CDB|nr:hypothetical protein [Streptomyces sp. 5-10]MBD3004563.1 hypothetical protein [Streptomyces sp. 5-10]
MKMKRNAVAGNSQWQTFMVVIEAGRGGGTGRLPRGGAQFGAAPVPGELSQLPQEWDKEIAHASHVGYHYGTPIVWLDERDGLWVIPDEFYSPQTSGVQNRIREYLGEGNYRTASL